MNFYSIKETGRRSDFRTHVLLICYNKAFQRPQHKKELLSLSINACKCFCFNEITDFIPDMSGWNDETCTLDSGLVEQTSDGYRSTVSAPSVLFKFIIGKKGETKRRLETETRTQIRIPRQGQEGDIGNYFMELPKKSKNLGQPKQLGVIILKVEQCVITIRATS